MKPFPHHRQFAHGKILPEYVAYEGYGQQGVEREA